MSLRTDLWDILLSYRTVESLGVQQVDSFSFPGKLMKQISRTIHSNIPMFSQCLWDTFLCVLWMHRYLNILISVQWLIICSDFMASSLWCATELWPPITKPHPLHLELYRENGTMLHCVGLGDRESLWVNTLFSLMYVHRRRRRRFRFYMILTYICSSMSTINLQRKF